VITNGEEDLQRAKIEGQGVVGHRSTVRASAKLIISTNKDESIVPLNKDRLKRHPSAMGG
jgi:hypothetical protein